MSKDQLFLLASIFAARRDEEHLAQLLPYSANKPELYDAVGALWPELDEPEHLEFLFEVKSCLDVDGEALLIQLIDSDSKLIPMVEMDHSIIRERCRATRTYVESRMNEVAECNYFKFTSFEAMWMRRRMILCNRLTPEDAASYRKLWEKVKGDKEFEKWIKGIVRPLDHVNKRLGQALTIEKFEAMDPLTAFDLILKTEDEFPSTVINREIIPYLENIGLCDLFLERIFTETDFSLNSASNIRNFSYLYEELCRITVNSDANLRVQGNAAQIIFNNSSNLLTFSSLAEIRELLSKIDDNVKVGNYPITVALLKHYTKCMESLYKSYSLKEIYTISREESLGQLAHFSAIVREQISCNSTNKETVEAISKLLEVSSSEEERVFRNLSLDQKTSVFIETVLEMGKFELLDNFFEKFDSGVDEDVLVKYFWHFFNKASNGLRSRPEMRNAKRTLDLLLKRDDLKYKHLEALLDVANDLSTYSLNLGKGVPFKPSDILTFAPKIFDLISLLLELNPQLYKDMNVTLGIAENLLVGLKLKERGEPSSSETFARVLVLHIDHSLANLDFGFALDGTKELLKMENISSFWPTIFQVGKFVDPSWPDGEAPIDVLAVQLEILGDLLNVCPVEEAEAIVSQWSAIELELVTRDPAVVDFSTGNLEAPAGLLQGDVLSGVSHSLSSFLSGDINRVIKH